VICRVAEAYSEYDDRWEYSGHDGQSPSGPDGLVRKGTYGLEDGLAERTDRAMSTAHSTNFIMRDGYS
jgi:hypothetical protein